VSTRLLRESAQNLARFFEKAPIPWIHGFHHHKQRQFLPMPIQTRQSSRLLNKRPASSHSKSQRQLDVPLKFSSVHAQPSQQL
jgi:hypothetical protein